MADVLAIKCNKCGAPSYSDQTRGGFFCPYCGDCMPWTAAPAHFSPSIGFRHRPVPVVDGLLKLTHVGLPERPPEGLLPEKDYIRTSTANPVPEMTGECTLFSPPVPIVFVKSPFLYQVISLKEAIR